MAVLNNNLLDKSVWNADPKGKSNLKMATVETQKLQMEKQTAL